MAYLDALARRMDPVPVPLSRLARILGTTARTLVEHVEPWLFQLGLVRVTRRGRVAAPEEEARARTRPVLPGNGWRTMAPLTGAVAGVPNVRRIGPGQLATT